MEQSPRSEFHGTNSHQKIDELSHSLIEEDGGKREDDLEETATQHDDLSQLPNGPGNDSVLQQLFVVARPGFWKLSRAALSLQEFSGALGDIGKVLRTCSGSFM
jgi:predicted RNA polymerase sigma factor